MKAVVFDLMGVVIDDALLIESSPQLGSAAQFARLRSRYRRYENGSMSREAFWRSYKNYPALEKRFLDRFRLGRGLSSVAGALSSRYQLAVLSNMPKEWGEYLVEKLNLRESFSAIVLSGAVKASKPSERIYRILLRTIGVPAQECVFIDDRIRNLKPAARLGMRTVWMKRVPTKKHPYYIDVFERSRRQDLSCGYRPDVTITALAQLPETVRKME